MLENCMLQLPRAFVCYAREDEKQGGWKTKITSVLEALAAHKIIKMTSDSIIEIGDQWNERIICEMRRSDLIVFLISVNFLRSKFVTETEVPEALRQYESGKAKIMPILIRNCDWQYTPWAKFQVFPRNEAGHYPLNTPQISLDESLANLSAEIRDWSASWKIRKGQDHRLKNTSVTHQPYPGLSAFDEETHADFFGREELVEWLWRKILRNKLTLLAGASGSGKSSVMFAGLLPRLSIHGSWKVARMTPRANPLLELATALVRARDGCIHSYDDIDQTVNRIRAEKNSISKFVEVDLNCNLFIFIDQFEEVMGTTKKSESNDHLRFFDAISSSKNNTGQYVTHILTAIRSDFIPLLQKERPEFVELCRDSTRLMPPLGPKELATVICKPAERRDVFVDPSLVALLTEQIANNADALPLLEVTLQAIWQDAVISRRSEVPANVLTPSDLNRIGNVAGAVTNQANLAMAKLSGSEAQVQQLLLALVRIQKDRESERIVKQSRTRSELNELNPSLWPLAETLASERLLVIDRDQQTQDARVEIVHEALIRQWDKLAGWVDNERELLNFRRTIADRYNSYASSGNESHYFLSEKEAEEAIKMVETRTEAFSNAQTAYIRRSYEALLDQRARQKAISLVAELQLDAYDGEPYLYRGDIDLLLKVQNLREREKLFFFNEIITRRDVAIRLSSRADVLVYSLLGVDNHDARRLVENIIRHLESSEVTNQAFPIINHLLKLSPVLAQEDRIKLAVLCANIIRENSNSHNCGWHLTELCENIDAAEFVSMDQFDLLVDAIVNNADNHTVLRFLNWIAEATDIEDRLIAFGNKSLGLCDLGGESVDRGLCEIKFFEEILSADGFCKSILIRNFSDNIFQLILRRICDDDPYKRDAARGILDFITKYASPCQRSAFAKKLIERISSEEKHGTSLLISNSHEIFEYVKFFKSEDYDLMERCCDLLDSIISEQMKKCEDWEQFHSIIRFCRRLREFASSRAWKFDDVGFDQLASGNHFIEVPSDLASKRFVFDFLSGNPRAQDLCANILKSVGKLADVAFNKILFGQGIWTYSESYRTFGTVTQYFPECIRVDDSNGLQKFVSERLSNAVLERDLRGMSFALKLRTGADRSDIAQLRDLCLARIGRSETEINRKYFLQMAFVISREGEVLITERQLEDFVEIVYGMERQRHSGGNAHSMDIEFEKIDFNCVERIGRWIFCDKYVSGFRNSNSKMRSLFDWVLRHIKEEFVGDLYSIAYDKYLDRDLSDDIRRDYEAVLMKLGQIEANSNDIVVRRCLFELFDQWENCREEEAFRTLSSKITFFARYLPTSTQLVLACETMRMPFCGFGSVREKWVAFAAGCFGIDDENVRLSAPSFVWLLHRVEAVAGGGFGSRC